MENNIRLLQLLRKTHTTVAGYSQLVELYQNCDKRVPGEKPRPRSVNNSLQGLVFHAMGLGRVELPTSRLSARLEYGKNYSERGYASK